MYAISFPLICRIADSLRASRFFPSNSTVPPTILPGCGTILNIDCAVTVFPEPDSPTSPSVSPLSTCRLTPSTAFTIPEQIESHHEKSEKYSRKSLNPPGITYVVESEVKLQAPRGYRLVPEP